MIENHLTASRKCGMIAKKVKKVNRLRRRFLPRIVRMEWSAVSRQCRDEQLPAF